LIAQGIQKLIERENLTDEESQRIMQEIMSGDVSDSQIAAFLTALRMKGETVEELTMFAKTMKKYCCSVKVDNARYVVDTCGTGGDGLQTFNISTTVAFVVAGAEITVAKHCNRSVTSKSGSADVIERLGLRLDAVKPATVEKTLREEGIGFMYAPVFHPSMKRVAGIRREMGIRTVFNILGPLVNPADANARVLGVYSPKLTLPLTKVLNNLSCEVAMVVHGMDGMDEISISSRSIISQLHEGEITQYEVSPETFGISPSNREELTVDSSEESAEITFKILNDLENSPARLNSVLMNAAAGIMIGGKADDFRCGLEAAQESIKSGTAYGKLREMIRKCGGELSKLEELELRFG
jgi:anthranilate phosphoribosyltransferase